MTTHTKTHTMENKTTTAEMELLKLAKVAQAGKALAIAAEAVNMKPEELTAIVVAIANKEIADNKSILD